MVNIRMEATVIITIVIITTIHTNKYGQKEKVIELKMQTILEKLQRKLQCG